MVAGSRQHDGNDGTFLMGCKAADADPFIVFRKAFSFRAFLFFNQHPDGLANHLLQPLVFLPGRQILHAVS